MIDLIVDSLATHRLARLVASDLITVELRDAFIRGEYARRGDRQAMEERLTSARTGYDWTARTLHDGADAPKLATLITCRWCSGTWLAFGVVVARRFFPRAWSPLARLLAFSSVAGLLGVLEHFAEPQKIEVEDDDQPSRTIRLG